MRRLRIAWRDGTRLSPDQWLCPSCLKQSPGHEPVCECGFERESRPTLAEDVATASPPPPLALDMLLFVATSAAALWLLAF